MKSIYFLPNTGIEKFDDINDKLKLALSEITEVKSFSLIKQIEYFPENFKGDIPELLFVPTIFDYKNAVSYQGVEFAMRWYFHLISNNSNCNFKIVLLGTENKSAFFQNCNYSNFIKCPNIDYLQNSFEDINLYISNYKTNKFEINEALKKIELIGIKPPTSYKSHHSISNEWSLNRYLSMFEKDENNALYVDFKKKILDLDYIKTLHFKYIEAKSSRQRFNPKKDGYTPIISGIKKIKIGIIDDEINKGWNEFYNYVLNKSNAQSIPYNDFRKDETREELLERIKNWILEGFKSIDPINLFIVDLRLHEDDFTEQDFKNLSGIQLIKFIKSKNPGVQIVVSTASNKVWNFQKCLEYGVKHYSIKESPDSYSNREESRSTFIHFSKQITNASEKSFLAILFNDIKKLKEENIFKDHIGEKEKEFEKLIFGSNGLLDQIFNLLVLDSTNSSIINQCLLIAFKIIENYCDLGAVGVFDYNNSSGKVCQKDSSNLVTIYNKSSDNKQILTKLELLRGNLSFQESTCSETIASFKIHEESKLISAYSGLDTTSLVKIICVFYFRDNISIQDIERIIQLRYYRSNVAAHLTGRVKSDYKISSSDIVFLISIFKSILGCPIPSQSPTIFKSN
jgi:hypothetical protein